MMRTVVYKKNDSDIHYTHNVVEAYDVSEALSKFQKWAGKKTAMPAERIPVYVISGNEIVKVDVVVEPSYRLTRMVAS